MHEYTKYFKEQDGFSRLIKKMYEKYQSLGRISGTIKLDKITSEEAKSLSRLFGITYEVGDDVKISINKFISIMESSKYAPFDINILVKEYLNLDLITKREEKDNQNNLELEFYQDILKENSLGSTWLDEVVTKKIKPYKLIHQRYTRNKKSLKKELLNIINLLDNLPKEKVLLSIFSSNYTKDPHYLDLDNNHSNLFFYALAYLKKIDYPNTREDKIKLLTVYNIEIDSLSNFVLTYNLLSNKDYINMFSKNKESLILNIQNIINTSYFDTLNKKVFIFENPSILTEIMRKNIDASVIISGGFPNACIYLLIDKLLKKGNKLYYNGDFDPEGVLIASKLKEKYGDNLVLFAYQEIDYKTCISKEVISENRLKKLDKVNDLELLDIKELLYSNKLSAYQENNKDRLIKFIRNIK